jgi:hypothetical protein
MSELKRRIRRLEARPAGRDGRGLSGLLLLRDQCADAPYTLADVGWMREQGGLVSLLADRLEEDARCGAICRPESAG